MLRLPAYHIHWAELCEIRCSVSTTKLGDLKLGEQGCSMAINELISEDHGI